MTRKVIQITTMGVNCIIALCDDGTIWQMLSTNGGWTLIKDVPQ